MDFWSIVLRLYLAHVIADFPLQTNKIYFLKTKYRFVGVIPHVLIHFFTMLLILFPFLNNIHILLIIISISIIHYIIDTAKVEINKYIYISKQSPLKELFFFFLDQFLHFITIFIVSDYFFPLNSILYPAFKLPHLLKIFYLQENTKYILLLISIIFATYGIPVIPYSISGYLYERDKINFKGKLLEEIFSKLYRVLILILLILKGYYFILIIFPIMIVFLYIHLKKYRVSYNYFKELVSTIATIILGIILRFYVF